MSYNITVRSPDYAKWSSYKSFLKYSTINFPGWLKQEYPEVRLAEYVHFDRDDLVYSVDLVFESEEHYHWFLLQQ